MRRHAGDQAWSDSRLIETAERLARHEDALDVVRELIEELRADVDDELEVDLTAALDRLEAAATVAQR